MPNSIIRLELPTPVVEIDVNQNLGINGLASYTREPISGSVSLSTGTSTTFTNGGVSWIITADVTGVLNPSGFDVAYTASINGPGIITSGQGTTEFTVEIINGAMLLDGDITINFTAVGGGIALMATPLVLTNDFAPEMAPTGSISGTTGPDTTNYNYIEANFTDANADVLDYQWQTGLEEHRDVPEIYTTTEQSDFQPAGYSALFSSSAGRWIWQRRPLTAEDPNIIWGQETGAIALQLFATGADKETADPIHEVRFALSTTGNTIFADSEGNDVVGIALSDATTIPQIAIDNAAIVTDESGVLRYYFLPDQVNVIARYSMMEDLDGETGTELDLLKTDNVNTVVRVVVRARTGITDPVYSNSLVVNQTADPTFTARTVIGTNNVTGGTAEFNAITDTGTATEMYDVSGATFDAPEGFYWAEGPTITYADSATGTFISTIGDVDVRVNVSGVLDQPDTAAYSGTWIDIPGTEGGAVYSNPDTGTATITDTSGNLGGGLTFDRTIDDGDPVITPAPCNQEFTTSTQATLDIYDRARVYRTTSVSQPTLDVISPATIDQTQNCVITVNGIPDDPEPTCPLPAPARTVDTDAGSSVAGTPRVYPSQRTIQAAGEEQQTGTPVIDTAYPNPAYEAPTEDDGVDQTPTWSGVCTPTDDTVGCGTTDMTCDDQPGTEAGTFMTLFTTTDCLGNIVDTRTTGPHATSRSCDFASYDNPDYSATSSPSGWSVTGAGTATHDDELDYNVSGGGGIPAPTFTWSATNGTVVAGQGTQNATIRWEHPGGFGPANGRVQCAVANSEGQQTPGLNVQIFL